MRRRLAAAPIAAAPIAAILLAVPIGPAQADFDAFLQSPPTSARRAADDDGILRVRTWEPRLGVPTMAWAGARPRPPWWVGTPAGAARHFVERVAARYRLQPDDLEHLEVRMVHDQGAGVIVVRFAGEVDGLPVLRDQMNVALDQKLRLLGITGYVSPFLAEARGRAGAYELAPGEALRRALGDHLGEPFDAFSPAGRDGPWLRFVDGGSPKARLGEPTRARRVLYGQPDRLEPAYHVEVAVETAEQTAMLAYAISGIDGRVLSKRDLVDAHPFTYRVFVDGGGRPLDGPNGNDEIPDFSGTPGLPPRDWETPSRITLPHAGIGTADPWMTQSSSVTAGNNVDAYADLAAPDGLGAGDLRASTTGPDTFDFVFDPQTDASANDTQRRAAIVHAFYVANWLHDEFYDHGFDEAAGNAQRDNYGRGGVDGDDMRVEVQDYSGTNNANMATPADGGRPRMQMYLWTGAARAGLRVLSPARLETDHVAEDAAFGPRSFDVEGDLVVATDAGGVSTLDACDPPVTSAVSGAIALIERGRCTFASKVLNAQSAGALGVVIYDENVASRPPALGGSEPQVSIGAVSITREVGLDLEAEIGSGPVRVRIHRDPRVQTDSAVDSMVVAHEWGHYVSNRLIGNAFGLSGNQARGMGEGWSDFHGMLLTVREDDASIASNPGFRGAYAGATSYVSRTGPYFGIRRVPYSTDFSINALTFRHIQAGEPLPAVPTAFGADGSRNTFVHQTGEVWATALWEAWSALISSPRLTFDQAYERMKSYLIAGYKLTPVNPTFVEARDALLLAAFGTDPDDFELMYEAFARRGLGIGAEAPDRFSTSQTPLTESFASGAYVDLGRRELNDERLWCDREGVLDGGETGSLFLDLANLGSEAFDDPRIELRALTPGLTFPDGARQRFGPLAPFGSTTATVAVALARTLTEPTLAEIRVDVSDARLALGPTQTATIAFRVHADEVAASSATDDVEAERTVWSTEASSTFARGFERFAGSPVQHWWFGVTEPFPAEATLTSPSLAVPAGTPLQISFRHRYDIEETWDGAVIEVSRDGVSWEDASVYADPGYPVTLRTSSNNPNPLRGRAAYSGRNPNYPGWDTVTLDFGTQLSGGSVFVRFRVGSDWAVSGPGWEVDDIAFSGIAGTPFAAVVADRGRCVNRPPVADAGFDLVVDERTEVVLDAASSRDPDGDPLEHSWAQIDGPAVAVTSTTGRFIAPEVEVGTELRFELKVSDREFVSEGDVVAVWVRNVNRPPFAPALDGPSGAVERAEVTLTATATDPDRQVIERFWWEAIDGPPIEGTHDGAVFRFTAPEVSESATVTVRVAASDGVLFGPFTEHRIRIRSQNRLPSAPEVRPKSATEGDWVSLVARATDPDRDPLTYSFRPDAPSIDLPEQIRGGQRFRFRAPQVDEDRVYTFSVVADDGFGEGPPTSVTVRVIDEPEPIEEPDEEPDTTPGPSEVENEEGCGCIATSRPRPGVPFGALLLLGSWLARRPRPKSREEPRDGAT